MDITNDINDFFETYFKHYLELIEKNNIKIKQLKPISYPELDYLFVFKFVRIEIDHLKNIDASILDKELREIFDCGLKSASELLKFKKGLLSAHVIFRNKFSNFHEEARRINERFEKAKASKTMNAIKAEKISKDLQELKENDRENITAQKAINAQLAATVQSIQNARDELEVVSAEKQEFEKKYLPIFLDTYKKNADDITYELIKQIAVFSFMTDKELWINASRSRKIMTFFSAIHAEDNMNIENYMEYHLNSQTSLDNKGKNAIAFRKKLIDSINRIRTYNAKIKATKRNP